MHHLVSQRHVLVLLYHPDALDVPAFHSLKKHIAKTGRTAVQFSDDQDALMSLMTNRPNILEYVVKPLAWCVLGRIPLPAGTRQGT